MDAYNVIETEKHENKQLQNQNKSTTTPLSAPPLMSFKFVAVSSHIMTVKIEINPDLVEKVYHETILFFRKKKVEGFDHQTVPTTFLEETFKAEIIKKIKSYFLHHHVIDSLINEVINNKLPYANQPRLSRIEYTPGAPLIYYFDLSLADPIQLKEWKDFAFRASHRKRYKDLDKQVIQFLEQETTTAKKNIIQSIESTDWVCIEIKLLNQDHQEISEDLVSYFWVKMKQESLSDQFSRLLINKKIGDSFITQTLDLEEYANDIDSPYFYFFVTIISISKGSHFSLDLFKQTYRLKNKIDVHNKLMEVFSYRNDISQRKTTIEDMFALFMSKHRFEIPKHLIIRRQESLLEYIMQQSDYHVYRSQYDFLESIEQLAEQQLREEILIDQIAYQENITVDTKDIQQYLNLFNHRRLKEFIYFKPSIEIVDEHVPPINASLLLQAVLREKTLNFMLHALTR